MRGIPEFTSEGVLPAGDHVVTFDELRASILVAGPVACATRHTWDAPWRAKLVDNLEFLTRQLWQIGITEVFADGSFTEDKDHPNDIDGYFVTELHRLASGRLERELNLLDPAKVWTWDPASRRAYRSYTKRQLPMWHVYRVELYPHVAGLNSGIKDQFGHDLEFPSAFRQSRHGGNSKGIVRIEMEHHYDSK